MPIFIHFVRHAQGFHNLSLINQHIPDPDLTPTGKRQCAALCQEFPHHDEIAHLVASPLRRTLYTCLLSFAPAVKAGKVVTALPELQEVSRLPCDVGSSPARLRAEFDDGTVDLGLVTDGWNDKRAGGPWEPEMGALEARARKARAWLRDLAGGAASLGEGSPDVHVVAVTHGGILHFLTEDWDGLQPDQGTGWYNCERRTYEFADPTGRDAEARVRETAESWQRRKGEVKPLTGTEQTELKAIYKTKLDAGFGVKEAGPEQAVVDEDDGAE